MSVPAAADPESPAYACFARTIAGMAPVLERGGVATSGEVGIDTLNPPAPRCGS
ncbi:hypothetical protein [Nonomuraea sp. NPDC050202]|uniref:hypothetical protein n=1 Tax=Nonomuraea sp. NPDC050202 TaxID=3155035 RepID=UPI0033D9ADAE